MMPACPVCETTTSEILFEQPGALICCNRPAATHAEALAAPRADLRLAICAHCSHIYNTAFDPEDVPYTEGYENALHFSETFGRYTRGLAEELVAGFDLHDKHIVDIGCGDGAFLRQLCELGGNRGTGFDPAAPPSCGDVELITAPYSAAHTGVAPDFVSCRHVLEHLARPRTFLGELTPLLRTRSAAYYFEVPNGVKTFDEGYVWDVLYEHGSYFTPRSLRMLFDGAGLNAMRIDAVLDGQFLALRGRMTDESSPPAAIVQPHDLGKRVFAFARQRTDEVERWRTRFADLRGAGREVAVWGAGTKGVTFLDAVAEAGSVAAVVDVNPRKQGKWMAGSGLRISAPEVLRALRPHTVVVMNPVYRDEIVATLVGLGLAPEIISVTDAGPYSGVARR